MARPKRDYGAEYEAALKVLEAYFDKPGGGFGLPFTPEEVEALKVMLPRTTEIVDDLDEAVRRGD